MINKAKFLLFLLSLGWLLTGLGWPAFAQEPTELAAPDPCMADVRCAELANQGIAQHRRHQYAAALASFREAYALHPVPSLLFNIGRTYQGFGKTDEALAAYRAFLQQSETKGEALVLEREKARVAVEQIERARTAYTAAPGPDSPLLSEKKPIYKKWWFWTIISSVTVATVTGLAVGLSLRNQEPMAPPGVIVVERTF